MKNKVTNYQIKAVVDHKKRSIKETLCEEAMTELNKIYWHEKETLIVIPILLSNAKTLELVDSLSVLYEYTKKHVELLESKFPDINSIPMLQKTYYDVTYKNIL